MESWGIDYLNHQIWWEKSLNFQFFMDSFHIFVINVVLKCFFWEKLCILVYLEFWERNRVWLVTLIFSGFDDESYVHASNGFHPGIFGFHQSVTYPYPYYRPYQEIKFSVNFNHFYNVLYKKGSEVFWNVFWNVSIQ